MKKLFFILILMFSFILVNADENEVKVRLEWIPNVYYNYEKDGVIHWGQFAYLHVDDKIAYCLDINQTINSEIYTKSSEVQAENLVILAGYFGYGYDNNNTLKDYMATQKLIWRYLGVEVYFTTESAGGGKEIDIDSNESRIIYTINNHAYFPTYDTDYKFKLGTDYNLIQKNAKLHEYNIINNTSNIINFNDSGITFESKIPGNNYFYLESKYEKFYENIIYIAEGSQKIMVIGGINNLKRKYSYEVIGGTLDLNVILKGVRLIDAGLVNENVFELYLEDKLIGAYNPNELGNIKITNLNLGNYTLKHIIVSEGYLKEYDEYSFSITSENLNIQKEIILNLKTTNVKINKSIKNILTDELYYDAGIIYKIYDKDNNFIKEVITDENGNANFNLEYGNYKIVQTNTVRINVFHDDILVNKNDFSNDLEFNIYDEYYNAKIKFIVLDKEENKPIKNLKFNINNIQYVTNEEGYYITSYLLFDTYKFSNISYDGYKSIDNFEFVLNEDCEYYFIDNNAIVDIIVYMEKEVKNEIVIPEIPSENKEEIIVPDNEIIEEDKIDDGEEKSDSNINLDNNLNGDNIDKEQTEDEKIDENKDNTINNSNNSVIDKVTDDSIDNEEKDNNTSEEKVEEDLSNENNVDINSNSNDKIVVDESIKDNNVTKKEEKLPFLGEILTYEKIFKVFNYKFYYFKFIRL